MLQSLTNCRAFFYLKLGGDFLLVELLLSIALQTSWITFLLLFAYWKCPSALKLYSHLVC